MNKPKYLLVGGLVAMGLDRSGQFLLTVTHSGRGVFSVGDWQRVARDHALAYPEGGKAIGIGPIDGQVIEVQERDETREQIKMQTPGGRFELLGESDGITINEKAPIGIGPPLSGRPSHTTDRTDRVISGSAAIDRRIPEEPLRQSE